MFLKRCVCLWCRHGPFYPVPSLTGSQGHLSELACQPHQEVSCQLGKESTRNPGVCLVAACQELQVRSVCSSASLVLEHVCIYMKSAGTPSSARGQAWLHGSPAGTCAPVTGHGSQGSRPVLTTAPAQCAGEIPPRHIRGGRVPQPGVRKTGPCPPLPSSWPPSRPHQLSPRRPRAPSFPRTSLCTLTPSHPARHLFSKISEDFACFGPVCPRAAGLLRA